MTEVDVRLGRQIRRLREQLGMSQEELAKKLGYRSKSSINKVETGSQGLTQSKIMRFAEALQTTPGELLDWASDDTSDAGYSNEQQRQIFSENLRKQIEMRGLTQKEVADGIGEFVQTVSAWACAKSLPRMGKIQRLADYFGIEKSQLINEQPEEPSIPSYPNVFPLQRTRIPSLGQIACGEPSFCNEDRESYVMAGADVRADFCLKARGDSMTGARIMDGDIVFIRKDAELVNGGIYAVEIDDEATLKRVYYDEAAQELRLLAENPKYPTMVYSGERLAHVHVLGKAIAFQSDVI